MIELGTVVALGLLFAVVLWQLLKNQAEQAAQWATERRELLTRIQRPDTLPNVATDQFVVPDPEPDGTEEVGTINYDDRFIGEEDVIPVDG